MPETAPDFTFEDRYHGPVCGIDEVGRGPWAGPVMAACVVIPHDARDMIAGVNDSKRLHKTMREKLATIIQESCPYGIGQASVTEIDTLNIRQATHLAMQRAFSTMQETYNITPVMALIDGRENPTLPCPILPIIKGDTLSMSIAAAAIIAKVARDQVMCELHHDYPDYGWNKNAGYGVPAHQTGINTLGITPHHRRSFAPIRKILTET